MISNTKSCCGKEKPRPSRTARRVLNLILFEIRLKRNICVHDLPRVMVSFFSRKLLCTHAKMFVKERERGKKNGSYKPAAVAFPQHQSRMRINHCTSRFIEYNSHYCTVAINAIANRYCSTVYILFTCIELQLYAAHVQKLKSGRMWFIIKTFHATTPFEPALDRDDVARAISRTYQ